LGSIEPAPSETNIPSAGIQVSIENDSNVPGLGRKLAEYLQLLGYTIIHVLPAQDKDINHAVTRIVAQRANPEDAQKIKDDLKGVGQIVNQSIGNIDSAVTIMVGDDLIPMLSGNENLHGQSQSMSPPVSVYKVRPGGL
jgi:hypothetical protein